MPSQVWIGLYQRDPNQQGYKNLTETLSAMYVFQILMIILWICQATSVMSVIQKDTGWIIVVFTLTLWLNRNTRSHYNATLWSTTIVGILKEKSWTFHQARTSVTQKLCYLCLCFGTRKTIGVRMKHAITKSLTVLSRGKKRYQSFCCSTTPEII